MIILKTVLFNTLAINLCYILFFFGSQSFSQTNTFDRTYPQFGNNCYSNSIKLLNNGNFIVSAYNLGTLYLTEMNHRGDIVWFKEYGTHHLSILGDVPFTQYGNPLHTSNIIQSADSNITVVSTILNNESENTEVFVMKLNPEGDTIWTQTYGDSSISYAGFDIYGTSDGGYIVGALKVGFSLQPYILKIDSLGNLLWNKKYSESVYSNLLVMLNSNKFILATRSKLRMIDLTGTVLWEKNLESYQSFIAVTSYAQILIASENSLEKLDSLGNRLSFYEFSSENKFDFSRMWSLREGNIMFWRDYSIVKTDSTGEKLWKKNLGGIVHNLLENPDSSFIFAGVRDYYNSHLWISKTDLYGNLNTLRFTSIRADGKANLHIEDCSTIKWFSSGVNKINLDYSLDNSSTWQNLLADHPVEDGFGSYRWNLPDIILDSGILSLTDTEKPEFTDTLMFSLTYTGETHNGSNDNYDYIAANDIKMWISNNGDGSHDPIADGSGFFWPGGNCAIIPSIFEDGFVYGGIVDSLVNVNGSTYRQGWQSGNILEDGTAANPNDPVFKIWKIKKDWEFLLPSPIRDKYEFNYNHWPVEYGAPWVDVDEDGLFTKNVNKPKFVGDEVLFHVSNDLDAERTNFVYGSPPIGLEFQVTVWAHNTSDFLKDVVFKKYLMINKSGKTIKDMYFGYWTDDDMGYASDDFVGCDTLLNLAYSYNGDNFDDDFYGQNPPAVGHMIVQGSIVPGADQDSAKFKNKWIKKHTNLGLSTFTLYIGSDPVYSDPELGEAAGAVEIYNNMRGFLSDGDPFIDPHTGNQTKYCVAGDPVNGSGWYEGAGWPKGKRAGDRRYLMSSGPFDVAPGDTQEIVYAIFMARGSDNIQSVAELKNTARAIQDYWDNVIYTDVGNEVASNLPTRFELSQNYPNPFNPTTTIKYSIPSSVIAISDFGAKQSNEITSITSFPRNDKKKVILVVYDILGRKVKTLVNENRKPGNYTVEFDASNLTSGVYFYRLKNGDFIKTRKMLLLK